MYRRAGRPPHDLHLTPLIFKIQVQIEVERFFPISQILRTGFYCELGMLSLGGHKEFPRVAVAVTEIIRGVGNIMGKRGDLK